MLRLRMQKDALCGPPHSPPGHFLQGIPQRSRASTAHRDDGLRDAFPPARTAAPATKKHENMHPSPCSEATPRPARPPAAPPAHRPSAPLRSRPLRCQSPEAVAAAWPRYLGPFPPPACCTARATPCSSPAPRAPGPGEGRSLRGSATRPPARPWRPLAPRSRSAPPQRWPAASACRPPGAAPECSFLILHALFLPLHFIPQRHNSIRCGGKTKGATSSRCGARTKGATRWLISSTGSLKKSGNTPVSAGKAAARSPAVAPPPQEKPSTGSLQAKKKRNEAHQMHANIQTPTSPGAERV